MGFRALRSVWEQKIAAPIRRSIVDKPDSLQLPASSEPIPEDTSDVTPTTQQTPTTHQPGETSQTSEHRKTVSLENSTLKKLKKRLSVPRGFSRKEIHNSRDYDDDETLSESTFEDDEQIIFDAIKNQDYDSLIDFMNDDEIDANEVTSEGKRYLHECVVYDDKEACEIVLDAGAHINARDIFGWTALHFAAAFSLTEMAQYLLDKGADPRKKTKEGKTADEITEDPVIEQMLQISRARRGLRSVSTVSISDIEAAQEEFRRRNEQRHLAGRNEQRNMAGNRS